MKTKNKLTVKARRMYAAPEQGNSQQQWMTISSKRDDKIFCDFTRPVFVLPATDKAYRAMHRQIMEAIIDTESDSPAIILAAIGITPPPPNNNH